MTKWNVEQYHIEAIQHWARTKSTEEIGLTIRRLIDIAAQAAKPSSPLVTLK